MFPTIYGVALKGLGPATKFGAAGLVMAIVGGAIMPLVQGSARGLDEPRLLVHRPRRLLRRRRPLRALRPEGRAERDRRRARPRAVRRSCRTGAARGRCGVTGRRGAAAAAAVAALALALAACGDNSPTSATTDTKQLEVVSWWTSGSEAAALDALFAAFGRPTRASTRSTARWPAAPARRRSSSSPSACRTDDPPDVWQTFAGKSVQGYARRGVVRSVAPVFEREDLRARMHPTILRSVMRDGRPYGVPTGAHRSNVLWFNRRLLERAGVTPPSSGYTLDAFLADLEKVEASGDGAAVPRRQGPVHHGRAVREHAAELDRRARLEGHGRRRARLARRPGGDGAASASATMLRYTDPQAGGLTWDAATKKLAAGGCAFESMNDSAFGELIAAGRAGGRGLRGGGLPGHRRQLPRRRRRLRRRDEGEERQERARVPRRHQRARHAARVQQGEGVGPGRSRRRRLVADGLPAGVVEGAVGVAGAAVDRPRRGDEPGVPGGLLRGGRDVRPDAERGRVRGRPRGSGLPGQDSPALRAREEGHGRRWYGQRQASADEHLFVRCAG